MKYEVILKETLTYKIVVDAESKGQAVELAFAEDQYKDSIPDANDTIVESVREVEEE